MLDYGFFPSRNRVSTLGDHVLEIQKKKFAADAAKNCAKDHDLITRSLLLMI
jgi:hypothetical protein